MNKTLPLIIILTVIAFIPAILGAAINNGTGILPLDLILFTILPFIVLFLLLHFLFKYPTEVSAPAKAARPSRAPSMKALQAEEEAEEVGEVAAAEPEIMAEPAAVAEPDVTCPECGGLVTMNDPVCPHCGVKFEEEKGEEAVAEEPAMELPEAEPEAVIEEKAEEPKASSADFGLKCPTCGGSVGLEEKFCPHCGTDFEQKGDQQLESEKSEEELDALFGIAPEEKKVEEKIEEPKPEAPAAQKSDEITLTYEEPQEETPAPKNNKKGKRRR